MFRFWKKKRSNQVSTDAQRQKEDEGISDRSQIPLLSDDLLMMIFDQLTTKERDPISTKCKRFRELDFELGNKSFDNIYVNWNDDFHCIYGITAEYDFSKGHAITNPSLHNLRLFRRAKTENLTISLDKKCPHADIELISSILDTVTYEALSVYYFQAQDFDDEGRHLANAQVALQWHSTEPQDANRIRKLLIQLPYVNKLRLSFKESAKEVGKVKRFYNEKILRKRYAYANRDEYVLDDVTLLNIVSNTNIAILYANGECTAHGILKIFELVCRSELCYKYVSFNASKEACDAILSMPGLGFDRDTDRHHPNFIDRATRTIVVFVPNDVYYAVTMGKLDAEGRIVQNFK